MTEISHVDLHDVVGLWWRTRRAARGWPCPDRITPAERSAVGLPNAFVLGTPAPCRL